jgi:hypothetical protein
MPIQRANNNIEDNSLTSSKLADNSITANKFIPAVGNTPYFKNMVMNPNFNVDRMQVRNLSGRPSPGAIYVRDCWFINGPLGASFEQNLLIQQGYTNDPSLPFNTFLSLGGSFPYQLIQYIDPIIFERAGYRTDNPKDLTLSFWVRTNLPNPINIGFSLLNRSFDTQTDGAPDGVNLGFVSFESGEIAVPPNNVWTRISRTIPSFAAISNYYWRNIQGRSAAELLLDLSGTFTAVDSDNRTQGFWITTATQSDSIQNTFAEKPPGTTLQIAGVQLEVGEVATDFEIRPYAIESFITSKYTKRTKIKYSTTSNLQYNLDNNKLYNIPTNNYKTKINIQNNISFSVPTRFSIGSATGVKHGNADIAVDNNLSCNQPGAPVLDNYVTSV